MADEVYFIRPVGAEGPVKIGFSANPRLRLSHLLHWSPVPLEIVATMPGSRELERRIHAKFRHLHSHKEWFLPAPELSEAIKQVIEGSFDTESLPRGIAITVVSVTKERSEASRRRSRVSLGLTGARRRGFCPPDHIWERHWALDRLSADEREQALEEAEAWISTTRAA